MKARSRLQTPSALAMPARSLPGQDRILQQIQTITREIHALQAEVYSRMSVPAGTSKKRPPAEDALAAQAVAQFQVALDRLRHVLWFYIEQYAGQPGTGARWEPRPQERNSGAGLHRVLAPQSIPAASVADNPRADPPESFFDRLDMVVDTYLKAASPAPSTAQKRAKLQQKL